jgi:hypothetical protein
MQAYYRLYSGILYVAIQDVFTQKQCKSSQQIARLQCARSVFCRMYHAGLRFTDLTYEIKVQVCYYLDCSCFIAKQIIRFVLYRLINLE